ncbi:MAG: alpha/beta hydrolase [Proteobacteria bacterium]|nr:alpha/beta hydrolase [Pseudomonadota bacterium]MBU4471678.1 alpha/beta hydrolase [Pseudomonadota bacterium]MCG2750655.1 alpha/beta hydrolase [Desulfobacteraceae bacterium]
MPFIQANQLNVYYEVSGRGETLFVISGSGGDLRVKPSIMDSPLNQSFKVISYDQRGLGQTQCNLPSYEMKDFAEDAAAIIDALDIAPCHVLGISFGGMVAQELAIRYPEKIKKLGLACTSSGGAGGASYPLHELQALSLDEVIKKQIEISDTRINEEFRQKRPEVYRKILDDTQKRSEATRSTESIDGNRKQMEARKGHNTFDRLPLVKIPTAIFGGKYDGISRPENLKALQKQIPGATLEFFEGGHMFMIQDKNAAPRMARFFLE